MERLRAKANAVDAGGKPRGRFFRCDRFGIGFEGHFPACIGTGELCTHRFENTGEVCGIEQAGRPAAEVNGVNEGRFERSGGFEMGGGEHRAPIADFAFDGAGIRRIGRARGDSGVKITVSALGLAEGHLNVDPYWTHTDRSAKRLVDGRPSPVFM